MGIVLFWQWMYPPKPPVTPVEAPAATTQSAQGGAGSTTSGSEASTETAKSPSLLSQLTTAHLAQQASALSPAEALTTLKGETHQVALNTHGQLSRWEITEVQYLRKLDQTRTEPYLIADSAEGFLKALQTRNSTPEGEPTPQVAPFLTPTLSVLVNDKPVQATFKVMGTASDREVTLSARAGDLELTRTFQLVTGRYGVDVDLKVLNHGSTPLKVKLLGATRALQDLSESQGSMFSPPLNMLESLCAHSDELERDALASLRDKLEDKEPMAFSRARWVGMNNRYFMSALSSETPIVCVQSTEPSAAGLANSTPTGTAPLSTTAVLFEGVLSPNEANTARVSLYGGPKKLEALKTNSPSLSEAIDFGIFTPICLPMLFMMRTFYEMIPNWGIAIILLTLLVKLLTLPLTIKQYRSMAGMKKIQPEMQALKEQYQKTDPMRFQQETMALYKKHGVSPLAGCLPMLLMMPIYFALYRTIYSAVELYQASFVGWLQDLSMPDPYLITPIALGLLMLLQARLNPSPGMDPTQRRMMTTFMPLMFGGMMLFLPSGLVLYIFVNTILGIFQQVWSQKQSEATA